LVLQTGINIRNAATNALECFTASRLLPNMAGQTNFAVSVHEDVQLGIIGQYDTEEHIVGATLLDAMRHFSWVLLPAILGFLGPRINLLPVVPQRLSTGRMWRAISLWVMRRPVAIIAAVSLVIVALSAPAFHLRVGIPGPQILPSSVDSRLGNDILDKHLGIANRSPVLVVVERDKNTLKTRSENDGRRTKGSSARFRSHDDSPFRTSPSH